MMYKSATIMPWFSFTPGGLPRNPCDPNQYTLVAGPPSCPNPNNYLCAIQAINNFGVPIITTAVVIEIVLALENRMESTNVMLKP
ncbi:hypothetical protein [Sphingobacterium anhuiense]|uniref:hypothetical protein n=1 Tax=Sphingobacterium anhuiense TaxID=493780 RepID=UPI003C2D3D18